MPYSAENSFLVTAGASQEVEVICMDVQYKQHVLLCHLCD